jgi:ferrous iron transport protein A
VNTLREAKVGQTVTVVKLHGTKNAQVHIRKVAPLGDPVEVTVRGYELSLRKEDAAQIEVQ